MPIKILSTEIILYCWRAALQHIYVFKICIFLYLQNANDVRGTEKLFINYILKRIIKILRATSSTTSKL